MTQIARASEQKPAAKPTTVGEDNAIGPLDNVGRRETTMGAESHLGKNGNGGRPLISKEKDSRRASQKHLVELAWWRAASLIIFGKQDYSWIKTKLSEYWLSVLRRNEKRPTQFFQQTPFNAIVHTKHRTAINELKARAKESLLTGDIEDDFRPYSSDELLAEIARVQSEKGRITKKPAPVKASAVASQGEEKQDGLVEIADRDRDHRPPGRGGTQRAEDVTTHRDSSHATESQLAELVWWKEVSKFLKGGRLDFSFVENNLSSFWKTVLEEQKRNPSKFFKTSPFNAIIHKKHQTIVTSLRKSAREITKGVVHEVFRPFCSEALAAELAKAQNQKMGASYTADLSAIAAGGKAETSRPRTVDEGNATPSQLAELAWWRAACLIIFAKEDVYWVKPNLSKYWRQQLRWNEQQEQQSNYFQISPLNAIVRPKQRDTVRSLMKEAHESLWSGTVADVFQSCYTDEMMKDVADAVQWQKDLVIDDRKKKRAPAVPSVQAPGYPSPYKPYHGIFSNVFANWTQTEDGGWMEGVVISYQTVSSGEYGDVRIYDVRFEDNDIVYSIHEVWVESREDYLWRHNGFPVCGVNEIKKRGEDWFIRKRGYYEMTLAKGFPYNSLISAMRAYDTDLLQLHGSEIELKKLNFPDESPFVSKTVSRAHEKANENLTARRQEADEPFDDESSSNHAIDLPPELLELAEVSALCLCRADVDGVDFSSLSRTPKVDWEAVYVKASPSLKLFLDKKTRRHGYQATQGKKALFVPRNLRQAFDLYFIRRCEAQQLTRTDTNIANTALPVELKELAEACARNTEMGGSSINWRNVYDHASSMVKSYLDSKSVGVDFYKTQWKKLHFVPNCHREEFDSYYTHLLESAPNVENEGDEVATVHESNENDFENVSLPMLSAEHTMDESDKVASKSTDSKPFGVDNHDDCPVDVSDFSPELLELAGICSGRHPHRKGGSSTWKKVRSEGSQRLNRYLDSIEGFYGEHDKWQLLIPNKTLRKKFTDYRVYQFQKRYRGPNHSLEDGSLPNSNKQNESKESLSPEDRGETRTATTEEIQETTDDVEDGSKENCTGHTSQEISMANGPRENTWMLNDSLTGESSDNNCEPVDVARRLPPELAEICRLCASYNPRMRGHHLTTMWCQVYKSAPPSIQSYLDLKAPNGNFLTTQKKHQLIVPTGQLKQDYMKYRIYLYEKHQRQTLIREQTTETDIDEVKTQHLREDSEVDVTTEPQAAKLQPLDTSDCPVDTSTLSQELIELADLLSMRDPSVRYNKFNSVWPHVLERASPRLKKYINSVGDFKKSKSKKRDLVPARFRSTFDAYCTFLQTKRFGKEKEAMTIQLQAQTDDLVHIDEAARARDQSQSDDSQISALCKLDVAHGTTAKPQAETDESPIDISSLPTVVRELAKVCSMLDPSLPGRPSRMKFWSAVYNKAPPTVKQYIDSRAGFWGSKTKRDQLVPSACLKVFVAYRKYLVDELQRSSEGPKMSLNSSEGILVPNRKRDPPVLEGATERRQKQRIELATTVDHADDGADDNSEIHVVSSDFESPQEEWHEIKYSARAWSFEKRADERWQEFVIAVRHQWCEVSGLNEELLFRCWPNFQRNHRNLWQGFLDTEAQGMVEDCHLIARSAERYLMFNQDGASSDLEMTQYLKWLDLHLESRNHRLESTLDWLYEETEGFLGQPMAVQLVEWYDFWERVDSRCKMFRFLERSALKRHLQDCLDLFEDGVDGC